MEVFQCDFTQGYGMTEMTAAITNLSAAAHRRALAEKPELLLSAGRTTAGTEIRIVDADDNVLPNGAIGEVIARGAPDEVVRDPAVLESYLGEETEV